ETVDVLRIGLLPGIGADRQALIALPHWLAMIAAEQDDDQIRFLAVEKSGKLLVPVIDVVSQQPGGGIRLVENRELRFVGKFLVEPPGEATGEKIADDEYLARVRVLGLHFDGGERRLVRLGLLDRLSFLEEGLAPGLRLPPP